MSKHEVTLTQSGSWKEDMTLEDGTVKNGEKYSFQTEMNVSAQCTCGEYFDDVEEAYNHLTEISE